MPAVRDVGEFLYEPDGAVIRAGLVTAVAAGVDGGLVDDHIAYVTSDSSFRTPFARGYRILDAASPTARRHCAPRCASAASAGSPSRSAASTWCPTSCASGWT